MTSPSMQIFWNNLLGGSYTPFVANSEILQPPSSEVGGVFSRSEGRSRHERFLSLLRKGKEMSEDRTMAVQTDLQRRISTLEPENQKRLDDLNSKRALEGKPSVDFMKTTEEIESIMNDTGLSDKDKKSQIDALRKRLGLGKKDMKRLFTKRLAKIYKQAADQIKDHLNLLKQAVQEAENDYGKNSPQAQVARERLASAQQTLESTLRDFQHKSGLYSSMYPSFWGKLGGFFKKIGKGLFTVGKVFSRLMNFVSPFLRLIPGLGPMISFGWGALKGLVATIRGNWRGFLGGLINFARSIPGIGTLFEKTSEYLRHLISPLRPTFSEETSQGGSSEISFS